MQDLTIIELASITGGDGWSAYKARLQQDWRDTRSRASTAIHYNLRNGHWNAGRWVDNAAGTLFDGGKTVLDAVGGLVGLFK